jgi:hypothetical protein
MGCPAGRNWSRWFGCSPPGTNPRLDPDEQAARFQRLWQTAVVAEDVDAENLAAEDPVTFDLGGAQTSDDRPGAPAERLRDGAPTNGASDLARGLQDLLRGHNGLAIGDVEQAGQELLARLRESFQQAVDRLTLPPGASIVVEWFQASGPCSYWDRPYRLLNWHYHGLRIVVMMTTPESLRAECTPVPGISRARDAEFGLIAIDANRPGTDPLLLSVGDMHPAASQAGLAACEVWVEQCLVALLTEFGQALTGALARMGYDSR